MHQHLRPLLRKPSARLTAGSAFRDSGAGLGVQGGSLIPFETNQKQALLFGQSSSESLVRACHSGKDCRFTSLSLHEVLQVMSLRVVKELAKAL